ncbi:MAG: PfkB family carbohydrate kinase [Myxococcota bacterium]
MDFPLCIIGHVTRDSMGDEDRPGGAAYYATRAALALGHPVTLVTAAPVDAPEIESLRSLQNLTLHVKPSSHLTHFALRHTEGRRQVQLLAWATNITSADLPPFEKDGLVYLAPVIGEVTGEILPALAHCDVTLGAQGWMRWADSQGAIGEALDDALQNPVGLSNVIFSELDHSNSELIAARLASTGITVAVTRGSAGATLFEHSKRIEIPVHPVAEVDTTGAGDVFGVVFALEKHRGRSTMQAAQRAARAAANIVQRRRDAFLWHNF